MEIVIKEIRIDECIIIYMIHFSSFIKGCAYFLRKYLINAFFKVFLDTKLWSNKRKSGSNLKKSNLFRLLG